MRVTVNDPSAIPELISALEHGDCLADRDGPDTIAVAFPWVQRPAEARQALVELRFFARAWESLNPGLEVNVSAWSRS